MIKVMITIYDLGGRFPLKRISRFSVLTFRCPEIYLMHMLPDLQEWEKLCGWHIIDWIREKKACGQIRQVVLSGMNEMEQLDANTVYADRACPDMLTREENAAYADVKQVFKESYKVHCTGCHYCMPCPAGKREAI